MSARLGSSTLCASTAQTASGTAEHRVESCKAECGKKAESGTKVEGGKKAEGMKKAAGGKTLTDRCMWRDRRPQPGASFGAWRDGRGWEEGHVCVCRGLPCVLAIFSIFFLYSDIWII